MSRTPRRSTASVDLGPIPGKGADRQRGEKRGFSARLDHCQPIGFMRVGRDLRDGFARRPARPCKSIPSSGGSRP